MRAQDDSVIYTGVDAPAGMFDNEQVAHEVDEAVKEKERLLRELTPQLEDIIAMLDNEKATAMDFFVGYVDNFKEDDVLLRAELMATARYRKYLDDLKTKFADALNQTKGK